MASISFDDVSRLKQRFGPIRTAQFLRVPTLSSLVLLEGDITDAPPELPGQTYIRTNNYVQGWNIPKIQTSPSNVTGKVATNIEYAPWVGSAIFQAGIHRNRWPTDRGVMRKNRQQIIRFFQVAIRTALK